MDNKVLLSTTTGPDLSSPFVMEWPPDTIPGVTSLLSSGVNVAVTLEKEDGVTVRYELREHEHQWTEWEWVEPCKSNGSWWRVCPPCGLEETSEEKPS